MSDPPPIVIGEADLIGYRGGVERPKPLLELAAEFLESRVTVTRLVLNGLGVRYEVRVKRYGGPKLEGTPDLVDRGGRPVRLGQVDDVIAERDPERASEIAQRAYDELRARRIPILHELQAAVRRAPARPADL